MAKVSSLLSMVLIIFSFGNFASAQTKTPGQWFYITGRAAAEGPVSCGDDVSTEGSVFISQQAINSAIDAANGRALGNCTRYPNIIPETCRIYTPAKVVRIEMKRVRGGFQCFNTKPVAVTEAVALGATGK